MADSDNVWLYEPNVPLAIIASIIYGILFLAIAYLTFIKFRAWWFTVVVIGAAIEVAGYVFRTYSAKNQTELVTSFLSLTLFASHVPQTNVVLSSLHSFWHSPSS